MPGISRVLEEQLFKGKAVIKPLHSYDLAAQGAALECAIVQACSGTGVENLLQIDATTHPLGVEIDQQRMQFVIPRNTPFPTTKTVVFTTSQDYQKSFNIRIFEGGNEFTRDDLYLG